MMEAMYNKGCELIKILIKIVVDFFKKKGCGRLVRVCICGCATRRVVVRIRYTMCVVGRVWVYDML